MNLVSHTIEDVMANNELGAWQTISVESIPLVMAYILIHLVYEYPAQSNGYGFPFDIPYFGAYAYLIFTKNPGFRSGTI